jgi:hypothetical protein
VILFFKVFVLRSGKSAIEERSIFGINEEVEVKMIRDDRCRRRGRHEQKEVSCQGITVSVGLYILLVIPQHVPDLTQVPMCCPQSDSLFI